MTRSEDDIIHLCRWVWVDGERVAEVVSGARRGRDGRGPFRVKVDGESRAREFPRGEWFEVIP